MINLLSLIPLALSSLLKTRFFFFQLSSSVLARKIMWFSRDAPVVYLHGIQCKLLLFSLWCFNSDFQMINSTKEEISRFWASVTFEVFAFISNFFVVAQINSLNSGSLPPFLIGSPLPKCVPFSCSMNDQRKVSLI